MNSKNQILIVGGGLSGLSLAYFLQQNNVPFKVVEAAPRLGGRIHTQMGKLGTPLEIGATWFSKAHSQLQNLINELGLEIFPQFSEGKSLFQTKSFEPPQEFFMPASEEPSYRLKDGTESLIRTLASLLPRECLHLNTTVTAITDRQEHLEVACKPSMTFIAEKVVLCLPPQLAGSSIEFSPELPKALLSLLPTVQTWMAGSIKFTLEYTTPFWRQKGYSGMLFSHVGIVTEMYDHTNYEEDKFGFTGFLHGGSAAYSKEERQSYVLQQLSQLLGPEALQPVAYYDKVWTDALILGNNEPVSRPHYNNGHSLLQHAQMSGRLFFSGTETAQLHPGYMEGAVSAAANTLKQLLE